MPHEATSQFINGIRAARLLDDDRIKELESRPEAVWGDVASLSKYAQERGWLTPYQSTELSEGRGKGLNIIGYQVFDKLDQGPGGTTYKAIHPALQQPVSLRLVRSEWLSPADSAGEYVSRVQSASLAQSPYLANVLDAGTFEESPFVVQEFVDGCDLYRMVNEMGALPLPLASEYIRQAALALTVAHEKGIAHGDVSPLTLLLTPVKRSTGSNGDVSIRPRPGATIKLTELGLTPRRPPVGELTFGESDRLGSVAFLPPEHLASGDRTTAGDLYGLGASLYFLLTTRPPHAGESPLQALLSMQQSEPTPLETLRSDAPPALADLVRRLLARDPSARPPAADVVSTLKPFCESTALPQPAPSVLLATETATHAAVPTAMPVALDLDRPKVSGGEEPFAEEIPPSVDRAPLVEPLSDSHGLHEHHGLVPEVAPLDDHHDAGHQEAFGHSAMGADKPRAARPKTKINQKQKIMIAVGLTLHLIATTMCLGAFGVIPNPFKSSSTEAQHIEKDKKETTTKGKTKRP
jgi:eukaryotic-like serine/threonine-protein kinase